MNQEIINQENNKNDDQAYVSHFNADEKWTTIELPFRDLYPVYRGRMLEIPNYGGEMLEQIGFLFGNKKEEDFHLEIDWIKMR